MRRAYCVMRRAYCVMLIASKKQSEYVIACLIWWPYLCCGLLFGDRVNDKFDSNEEAH